MLDAYAEEAWTKEATLELLGGCRGEEDEERVK